MLAAIVVVPLLYLVLPTWVVASLLGLAALGPLIVGQYVVWRRWRGAERTLFQYRRQSRDGEIN